MYTQKSKTVLLSIENIHTTLRSKFLSIWPFVHCFLKENLLEYIDRLSGIRVDSARSK